MFQRGFKRGMMETLNSDINSVQEAVDHISNLRVSVEEKSHKLKAEIRDNFATIFDQLRAREEQLLRQVDGLTNSQTTSLSTQVAKLYYTMGRFKSALTSLQNEAIDLDKFALPCNEMENVKKIRHQAVPYYSLNLDTNKLQNTIQEFGRLDVLRTLLSFPPPEGSRSLPCGIEDYQVENEDHHFMHKALLDDDSIVKIRPPFKMTSDLKKGVNNYEGIEAWLSPKMVGDNSECSECPECIQRWKYGEVDDNDGVLLDADQIDGFVALDEISINTSNSIEAIAPPSRSLSPYELVTPLNLHHQSSLTEWLNDKKKEKLNERCPCVKEIEDMASFACCSLSDGCEENLKEKWLSQKNESKPLATIPNVADICIANEVCDSFRDCLCEKNCAVQWLHNNSVKAKNEIGGEGKGITLSILEPLTRILCAKKEDYLLSKGEQKHSSFKMNEGNDDIKNWLYQSNLTKENLKEASSEISEKIVVMLKPYLDNDLSKWLSN